MPHAFFDDEEEDTRAEQRPKPLSPSKGGPKQEGKVSGDPNAASALFKKRKRKLNGSANGPSGVSVNGRGESAGTVRGGKRIRYLDDSDDESGGGGFEQLKVPIKAILSSFGGGSKVSPEKGTTEGSTTGKSGKAVIGSNKSNRLRERRERAEELLVQRKALPIWNGREAIAKAVEKNDTIVIVGETGSGKTTQVPQFLYTSSIPVSSPSIAITQPRRVAATSLATRVAAEMGSELGGLVGYKVRFDDCTDLYVGKGGGGGEGRESKKTKIKYLTDGTLLREILGGEERVGGDGEDGREVGGLDGGVEDGSVGEGEEWGTGKLLEEYDVIVVDEAHERGLRTDMVLGILKKVQKRRKELVKRRDKVDGKAKEVGGDRRENGVHTSSAITAKAGPRELKVVVMSATLDAHRFSDFFNGAEILYVKGRQFPVKVLYCQEPQANYLDSAVKTFFQIHVKHPPGDVLIFLAGQEEIENLEASIKHYSSDLKPDQMKVLICPLYARLPPNRVRQAFSTTPPKTRKVILATNVAETSITIPGIKYVIDTGICKEKEWHAGVGVDSLLHAPISRSSAKQRTGRAGRESPGMCFRLYTEKHYLELAQTTTPEIQRCSLAFAVLHLLAMGQDVLNFDYMDPPDQQSIAEALVTLWALGAIDKTKKITKLGRTMSKLPLEPNLARILLASFEQGCPREVIDLLALMENSESLLINTPQSREEASAKRQKFVHRTGDHMTLLSILRTYEQVPREDQKSWCKEHWINQKSLSNVLDVRRQLRERCERLGLDWSKSGGEDDEESGDRILESCLAGLFGNTALRHPDGSYKNTTSRMLVKIHPSSSMHGKQSPAIMYNELVFTTQTFARGVSAIQPTWIRDKAPNVFHHHRQS